MAVCHDGKWGRRVKGVVVDTRKGHHVKIKFPNPENGSDVEFWARIIPTIRYKRKKVNSCIVHLGLYKHFAGWADIDYFCPWFSVYKWNEDSN